MASHKPSLEKPLLEAIVYSMIHMNGVEEGRILINAINTSFLTKLNDSILPQSIKLSDELMNLDQQYLIS